ncbi:MAG: fucose isomerase [Candidatus Aminicenantes bacterium]|nr:fucose isomerase [Candidatus Aminicenantes bacterium]
MIKIALIRLDSGRHDKVRFEKDRREFMALLSEEFTLLETHPGDQAEADLQVVFIASGGSEEKFRRIYPALAKPVILLADGKHNSLPAALEISSWVRQQGAAAKIVHGEGSLIAGRLKRLAVFQRTRRALAGPIGLIGEPSDWLIASIVDRAAVNALWGTEFIDIPLEEVIGRKPEGAEVAAITREWAGQAKKLDGVDEAALQAAACLVPTLKAVYARHRLRAATLRCFSLIERLQTSGCLALAQLNDEGMICGCEGDVPAVFSMLLLHALTGEIPFMANPAAVDCRSNRVVLAHCTVPRRAVSAYRLQTHFETGLGVALSGDFAAGPATVFKAGNRDLGSYFVSAAEVLPGRPQPGLCRTQVHLHLQEPVEYFLKAPLANHHLLIRGDHVSLINDFMSYSGANKVVIGEK